MPQNSKFKPRMFCLPYHQVFKALVNVNTHSLFCCGIYITEELKRPFLVPEPCMSEQGGIFLLMISDKVREKLLSLPNSSVLQTQGSGLDV